MLTGCLAGKWLSQLILAEFSPEAAVPFKGLIYRRSDKVTYWSVQALRFLKLQSDLKVKRFAPSYCYAASFNYFLSYNACTLWSDDKANKLIK